ncbi:MAG: hypothetical protein AAF492_17120, partial [Verrucomicrobiota bacterium]
MALAGIDGSGKSTVMRRFADLAREHDQNVFALTCPQFHDTPDVPLKELSRSLDAFSRASDSMGSFELKAAALFLQMTLYAPIEQFVEQTFRPEMILSERHPLIDTLAYGPFYTLMIREKPDLAGCEASLIEAIDREQSSGYRDILKWLDLYNARLGRQL